MNQVFLLESSFSKTSQQVMLPQGFQIWILSLTLDLPAQTISLVKLDQDLSYRVFHETQ